MRKVISFHLQARVNYSLHVGIALHCCFLPPHLSGLCLVEVDVACFTVYFVVCTFKREVVLLLFIAVFPSSRSCFVNPMKINVLSKGKPQQCLSFLTNSKRSFFTSRLSYVMCAYLWTWCYAAPSRSAFYKYFLSFLHSSPSSSLFHRHVES